MAKNIFTLLICAALLVGCGAPEPAEVNLDKFGITLKATPASPDKAPEFKELDFDNKIARYEFRIGTRRINFIEIEEAIFPESAEMLVEAIKADEDFKEMIDGPKHPQGVAKFANGVFGVLYSENTSKGDVKKDYIFYYKKGDRCFKITPVFNSELKDLDQQLAAWESIK